LLFFVVGGCFGGFCGWGFCWGLGLRFLGRLRERFGVEDGGYVRLVLVEVFGRGEGGVWVRRRVRWVNALRHVF
jgi:hypothetical protein